MCEDLLNSKRLKRFLIVLLLSYFIAFIFATARISYNNYSLSDGYTLKNGKIIGGDFICFYLAGKSSQLGLEDLYNPKTFHSIKESYFAGKATHEGYLPFVYPPLVAKFFSLFSAFSLKKSYFLWASFSLGLFFCSFIWVAKVIGISKKEIVFFAIACLSFEPFIIKCILGGQTSSVGFAIFTLVFIFLQARKDFVAGIFLGLFYYKPPLVIFFIFSRLVQKRWQMLFGFIIGSVGLLFLTIALTGISEVLTFLEAVSNYTYGRELMPDVMLPYQKGFGLYELALVFSSGDIVISRLLYISIFLLGLTFTYRYALRQRTLGGDIEKHLSQLLFCLDVSLSLLLSPRLLSYELTILLLPILIVYSLIIRGSYPQWLKWFVGIISLGFFLEGSLPSNCSVLSVISVKPLSLLLIFWNISLVLMIEKTNKSNATVW